jgi:hypothetical protein
MNKAFRVRMEARISGAIAEYHHARRIDHNGLVGAAREIAVRKLLDPMLPGFKTGTGTVITHDDLQSPQIDIVVYDERLINPNFRGWNSNYLNTQNRYGFRVPAVWSLRAFRRS